MNDGTGRAPGEAPAEAPPSSPSAGSPSAGSPSAGSPSAGQRAAEAALAAVDRVPPLVLVAVLAAVLELSLARVIWHGLVDHWPAADLIELRRWARFPRNLAAVAGIVAVATALFAFLRSPGYAPIGRRLAVAAFSGVFVPTVAAAALLPPTMIRRKLIVFSLAAANVLVTLVALTAVRYRAGAALRIGVGLASVSAFLTLLVFAVDQNTDAHSGFWGAVNAIFAHTGGGRQLIDALRLTAELCWMGVLVAGAAASAWDRTLPWARARLAGVIAFTVACTAALLAAQGELGQERFTYLMFGTIRLESVVTLAAVPLGLGLAGGLHALLRPEPSMRQLGAAMLLWLSAGFAPHTPVQLLYLVLAAMLLARAAQARDATGAWRQYQPWARLLGRSGN